MEIANTCEALVVRNSDLSESRFSGTKLTKSGFNDVNLLGSTFVNVNLGGAQFVDVNLASVTIQDVNLTESRFSDAKLRKSSFDDVNMLEATFVNANLGGAQFVDVNLAGVTIQDANLTGMTIDGILVSDLLRAFKSRAQTVLYARNLTRMQAFYEGVFLLQVEHAEPDSVVLAAPAAQLILVQIPESIAATIEIADPPKRRTETPIKLVCDVENLASARDTALKLGGQVDPVELEWSYQGFRVCDGHDPEGNVVQFRQK